ncbi:MAG: F0F1 ATP synthase subunit alpha [Thermoanaerobacterales bacterium]|nr:F0F1 ATP synthase subunit alpha [Thermoanaerobacterales bacterium]
MALRADEIVNVLKEKIADFEARVEVAETGSIVRIGDGVADVYGLERCVFSELVEFANGVLGMALHLGEDVTGCVIFGPYADLREGDIVRRTGRVASVPAGDVLLGRVVNPVGEPADGGGPVRTDRRRPVDRTAPGIIARRAVNVPLQTGIKAIDSMIPIGRGQRELILGDRQTGKTALAVDTILNQRGQDVICIYVAIGQKASSVAQIVRVLRERGALDFTIVVSATASDPAPLLYLAPFAGTAMGEEFMERGRDVLVVYDDLTRHAAAYREMALLLRRPPGREAFPGDIFYLHSRLLERAAALAPEAGGGTLTALPIVETLQGDLSAYIPTNVISITDGQIYLDPDLFYAGVRPAVNVGLSVSRVGGKAQKPAMRKVAGHLRLDLAQYRELAAFTQFGAELDAATRARLARGERVTEMLKQGQYRPMPLEEQVLAIFAAVHGYLDDLPVNRVRDFEHRFLEYMRTNHPEVGAAVRETGDLPDDLAAKLRESLEAFKDGWDVRGGK